MEQLSATTVDDLEALLGQFGQNVLYRGQTSHHGQQDKPSILTSFDRHGCIPSQMLKWSRYASNVLDVFVRAHDDPLGLTQALLQHYGWRSFYVDCSTNAAVGAWFASHSYSDRQIIEMSEDCDERPVLLRKRMAQYDFEEGDGHLYVFDKDIAARHGLIDLADLEIEGCRPRTTAQNAWLLGPLRNKAVPVECFRAHIRAPRSVLRDYAAAKGLAGTDNLFPPVEEDPILHSLLGLPWLEIAGVRDDKFPIPAFRRALELPEYHDSFVKIAWPKTAFFRGGRIADTFEAIEGDHVGGIGVTVPEIVLFGTADQHTPMLFPKVESLVAEHGTVAFEIDELIQHATMDHTILYQKGIGIIPHGADLFEVCELLVEHPGQEMTGAGFNRGWYYRRGEDGYWVREAHEHECGCGASNTHARHISALKIAEAFLAEPEAFED